MDKPTDIALATDTAGKNEHLHWERKHVTPRPQHVPVWQKIAYGAGGLTDFFYLNVLLGLANQIYVTGMKMNPAWLGVALAIPKVVGAIADPLVGSMSDNARSPWGRRRPYILVGGVAGALILPLMWCVPEGSQFVRFAYVAGLISLFSVFYSIFSIPYGALGYELTTDYDERTRVLAWRGYIQTIGVLSSAWFYKFCLMPIFNNEIVGARWLSVLAGGVMILGTVATAWTCHEKTEQVKQATIPLLEALRLTVRNKPFLLLQASSQMLALAMGITSAIGWLVFFHYVCRGDKALCSNIQAYGGTLPIITTLAAMPLGLWISNHMGKREGALVGMGIMLLAVAILPVVLTPAHPWWTVAAWMIGALGMPCAVLMFGSMTADICDEDELETGLRREGAYCAVNGFIGKNMQIVLSLGGGLLPWLAGYTDTDTPLSEGLMIRMKWIIIAVQFTGVVAALVAFWFYPITRSRSEATRRILDERKRATKEAFRADFRSWPS